MFFDHNLNQLPYYDDMPWDSGRFDYTSKYKQLIFFLQRIIPNDKKVCIVEHLCCIFDSANTINNSDVDFVVVNHSDHPLDFVNYVLTKPLVILGYNFKEQNYHPWHLLFSHWMCQDETVDFASPRKHLLSALHAKTRVTRVYNIVELARLGYLDNLYTTWLDSFKLNTEPINEDGLTAEDIQDHWDEYLDIQSKIPKVLFSNEYETCKVLGAGFEDTYLNIVQEARCADFGFLTEKIYKPIREGQLFLVQASPGAIGYLRSIGFDTFDDYIDHNKYDNELDWKKRTRLMHGVLTDIYLNIEEIFFKTVERRQANQKLLQSQSLVNSILNSIKIPN